MIVASYASYAQFFMIWNVQSTHMLQRSAEACANVGLNTKHEQVHELVQSSFVSEKARHARPQPMLCINPLERL